MPDNNQLGADDILRTYTKAGVDLPGAAPSSTQAAAPPQLAGVDLIAAYTKPAGTAQRQGATDPASVEGMASAAAGGFLDLPIVGPYIKGGVQKTAALIRSKMYGTPYDAELKAVQDYAAQTEAAHPTAVAVSNVAGNIATLAPLGATGVGARALGLVGSLGERAAAGALTGGAINAADSFARGGTGQETGLGTGMGALLGGGAPLAGRAIGLGASKLLSPAVDATTNYLMSRARDFGIPIRAAQASTSPFVHKMDQMVGKIPGSGTVNALDDQQGAFTRAVASTFGENADRITPEVMASAKSRIGKSFDEVAANTTIKFDQPFADDLLRIAKEAGQVLSEGEMRPLTARIHDIVAKVDDNKEISGDAYQALTRQGAPISQAQKSGDPNIRFYAGQMRDAVNDAMQRSASPEMSAKLAEARSQYKAMKTIEDLAEQSPGGHISPVRLMTSVRKSYPNMAYGGGGDLADLARIGQRFMKPPSDSGTPLGNSVMGLVTRSGVGLAGVALGSGGGYASGYDPLTDLGIGGASLALMGAGARGTSALLGRPQILGNALSRLPYVSTPLKNALTSRSDQ